MNTKLGINEKNKIFSDYAMIVFLNYIKNDSNEFHSQPSYLKNELNINDINKFKFSLIKKKYIKKKLGEDVVTTKGEEFIKRHEQYVQFFDLANPYINIAEFIEYKKNNQEKKLFEDIVIGLLIKKMHIFEKKGEHVAVKNIHKEVGSLYEKKCDKSKALYHYLTALYYDVSGLEYYGKLCQYLDGKCSLEEIQSAYDYIYIEPFLLDKTKELKEAYIEEMIEVIFEKNAIGINLCRKENFKELVVNVMEGKFRNRAWQNYFRETFKLFVILASKKKQN